MWVNQVGNEIIVIIRSRNHEDVIKESAPHILYTYGFILAKFSAESSNFSMKSFCIIMLGHYILDPHNRSYVLCIVFVIKPRGRLFTRAG